MPLISGYRSNIIRAEAVCRRSRNFNEGMLNAAKAQGRASNGRAMLIIHPLFTKDWGIFFDEKEPYLVQQIMLKDYDAYFDRLGRCLKSAKMVPFVLFGERLHGKVFSWLNGLELERNVFIQHTVKDNDPTPRFGFAGETSSWFALAYTLKKIEISKIFLAGELAYGEVAENERMENSGCVYYAQNALEPYFPGRVQVLRYLTFPGLFEHSPRSRQLVSVH